MTVGHFGGFYRRSWRANDFMWGRLDGAARIVEMLVSATRSAGIAATDADLPWAYLARYLAAGSDEQQILITEALDDLDRPLPPGCSLEDHLGNVLAQDLASEHGAIARLLCTRAAQFEILHDELRHLAAAVQHDASLGSGESSLGLDGLDLETAEGVLSAIRTLRASDPLPLLLNRRAEELTSDLATTTIANAGLIALGVARQAGGAPAIPLTALRSLLLPAMGSVSARLRYRLAAAAAFSAASFYLGARVVKTDAAPTVDARAMSLSGLLLAAVAVMVVIGSAAIPGARAIKGTDARIKHGAMAAVLLACGGAGSAAAALCHGPLTLEHLLIAPGVEPPWWAATLPIALGTGAVIAGPRAIRRWVAEAFRPQWNGGLSLVITAVAAALLAAWSWDPLIDALRSDDTWRRWAAAFALGAVPVAVVAALRFGRGKRPG